MRTILAMGLAIAFSPFAAARTPTGLPAAIYTDPAPDTMHPAGMEILHIPSGGVSINGVAYLPSGAGPHPILILFHGLPGNEKNLDIAQAARRAGWIAVTVNYRGSWGSPGPFRFANTLEDGKAVIAYLRDPVVAGRLHADMARMVIGGHSMGGWVTARIAAETAGLKGAILISAANMGDVQRRGGGSSSRAQTVASMAENMESLNTTPEAMADELASNAASLDWSGKARGLARTPLLILSSNDGLAPETDRLGASVRAAGGQVTALHVATDHSWSDKRIRLQVEILRWLGAHE